MLIHVLIRTPTHIYIYIYTYTYAYIYMYTYTFAYIYIYIHTLAYIYIYIYTQCIRIRLLKFPPRHEVASDCFREEERPGYDIWACRGYTHGCLPKSHLLIRTWVPAIVPAGCMFGVWCMSYVQWVNIMCNRSVPH